VFISVYLCVLIMSPASSEQRYWYALLMYQLLKLVAHENFKNPSALDKVRGKNVVALFSGHGVVFHHHFANACSNEYIAEEPHLQQCKDMGPKLFIRGDVIKIMPLWSSFIISASLHHS